MNKARKKYTNTDKLKGFAKPIQNRLRGLGSKKGLAALGASALTGGLVARHLKKKKLAKQQTKEAAADFVLVRAPGSGKIHKVPRARFESVVARIKQKTGKSPITKKTTYDLKNKTVTENYPDRSATGYNRIIRRYGN